MLFGTVKIKKNCNAMKIRSQQIIVNLASTAVYFSTLYGYVWHMWDILSEKVLINFPTFKAKW